MTTRAQTRTKSIARRTKRRQPYSTSTVAGDVELYTVALQPDPHLPLDVRMAGRSVWGARDGVYDRLQPDESIELVLDGRGVLECDGTRYELERGDVFLLHHGARHTYHAAAGTAWHKIFVILWPKHAQELLRQVGLHDVVQVRLPRAKVPAIKRLFIQILRLAHTKPPFFRDQLSECAYAVLVELAHIHQAQDTRTAVPAILRTAMEHVRQRGCHQVTARSMAAAAGCSLRHLSRLFLNAYHVTVHEWLTRYKMQHACALLRHSNHRIGDIAEALGYLDPLYFTKVFKRVVGRTPRAYRMAICPSPRVPDNQPGGDPPMKQQLATRRPRPTISGLTGDLELYAFSHVMDTLLPLDVYLVGRSAWSPGEHFERAGMFQWGVELVTGGRGVLTARGQTRDLLPGDVFFFQPYEHVSYATAPGAHSWQKVFVDFFPGNVAVIMRQLGLAELSHLRLSPQRLPRVRALFRRMLAIARANRPGCRITLSVRAYQLLLALSHEAFAPAHRTELPHALVRVMNYVDLHPAHRLNSTQLAHIAGCSVRHLNRHFHRVCGMSSHEWIERNKVQRACLLLTQRADTIGAIARDVGYRDPLHFCKVFKRITGQSPRAFRTQLMPPRHT